MQLKIFVSLVLFVLLASFSSCDAAATKTIVVEVSCSEIQENKHITKEIVASVGDIITIELCSYLTMGYQPTNYRWKYVIIRGFWEPIVREKNYEFVATVGEEVKTGGDTGRFERSNEKQIWTFEVIGKGTNIIRMEYTIQEFGVETINRMYSMNVTVN